MKFSLVAAVAALSIAQPASAAIIQVSLTGSLSSGFDQSGMFGTANTDLTGAAFSLVELYDTTKGTLFLGSSVEDLGGGIHFNGDPSSPGSAILTVNGVSVAVGGNSYTELNAWTIGSTSTVIDRFIGDHVTTENIIEVALRSTTQLHILDGWHSDCPVQDDCRGNFYFTKYTFLNVNSPGQADVRFYENRGYFDVDSYDVKVLAVPEPATWAMMIVGFGLVGAAVRRRTAVTA